MSARLARKSSARSALAVRRRHRLRGGAESLEDRSLLSVTPQELAVALTHSAEHYANVVQADYQHYLGRSADPQGLQNWVGAMQHGETAEQLEAEFIGSQEYIANHGGSPSGWVSGMYQDLLGRSPDQEGVDHWVQALQNGASPSDVAHGFAASQEREEQRVTNDYVTLLGRTPSAAEVDAWVNAFEHGLTNDDVAAGFVGSPEFYHAHGGNKADFLNAAYQEVLGRNCDAESETHWLDEMGAVFQANLTSSTGATGQAEYNMEGSGNEFQVEVKHAAPNSTLDVTVDSVVVGQIAIDAGGEGKLSFSSQPGSHEAAFPSNFPQIQANTPITVGSDLSGNFQAQIDG